ARLVELPTRLLRDLAQRRGVGCEALPEEAAALDAATGDAAAVAAASELREVGDLPVRRPERDRVDGDPGAPRQRCALQRQQLPTRLVAVGKEEDRHERARDLRLGGRCRVGV